MERYKPIRKFKVGGMTFIQIGQFSLSYCMTRKREPLIDRPNFYRDFGTVLAGIGQAIITNLNL